MDDILEKIDPNSPIGLISLYVVVIFLITRFYLKKSKSKSTTLALISVISISIVVMTMVLMKSSEPGPTSIELTEEVAKQDSATSIDVNTDSSSFQFSDSLTKRVSSEQIVIVNSEMIGAELYLINRTQDTSFIQRIKSHASKVEIPLLRDQEHIILRTKNRMWSVDTSRDPITISSKNLIL